MAEKRVKLFSNNFMASAFALTNFLLVLLLMWTVSAEYAPEWKRYQREYYRLFAEQVDDPSLQKEILATPLEIQQVWDPKLELTDRCMTCHMGVNNPKMANVPQPFKVHPDFTQHSFERIGCTVCHEGQGAATTVHDAHVMEDLEERFGPYDAQHIGWKRPLLPLEYVQASCNKCHNVMQGPVPGADHLNAGWQLVQEKGCKACHYIVDGGAKQAPELSLVGTKFYNESGHGEAFHGLRFGYLKESLRCPQANMNPTAAEKCRAVLEPEAASDSGEVLPGPELAQKYGCVNCHKLDAPDKLVGPSLYDIGKRQDTAYIRESIVEPDKVVVQGFPKGLMKVALSALYQDSKKNPAILDGLVQYLAGLKGEASGGTKGDQKSQVAAAPVVVMPNFNLNDDELRNVVTFLLGLQESTVSWPQKSFAKKAADGASTAGMKFAGKDGDEIVKLAGCAACHKLDSPDRLVGPSLWDIGSRKEVAYIRESILEPDKIVVAGFPPGVMKATLQGTAFYQNISLDNLEKLVDYLAGLKGGS
ncbi:MAG: c-type cytochrome [bacterium]|nr:c-type cytochrome [bacterium]